MSIFNDIGSILHSVNSGVCHTPETPAPGGNIFSNIGNIIKGVQDSLDNKCNVLKGPGSPVADEYCGTHPHPLPWPLPHPSPSPWPPILGSLINPAAISNASPLPSVVGGLINPAAISNASPLPSVIGGLIDPAALR